MLNDGHGFKKVFIATGYTDLRRDMEGLAAIIRFQFELDPYDKNTLFLFCGKRSDRIKGLLWEGDGFLLLYKRLDNQYPPLRIKSNPDCHDRLIVIDYGLPTEQSYHCGASSKDAGKKLCAINKIVNTEMIRPVMDKLLLGADKVI